MNACQVEEEADKKFICDIINSDISTIVMSTYVSVEYGCRLGKFNSIILYGTAAKNIIFHLNIESDCLFVKLKYTYLHINCTFIENFIKYDT